MRKASKLFVLCMLAALSVMALSAAAAQADTKGGEFRIEGKTFADEGISSEPIKGTVGEGELLTEGGIKVHCTGGSGTGVVEKGGLAKAQALLTGCTVLENAQCHVYEKLGEGGKLEGEGSISASGVGHLLLHEGKHYLLVEGLEKETLVEDKRLFSLFDIFGKFCPLNEGANPFHVEITGSTVVELPDALTNQKAHEILSLSLETLKTLWTEVVGEKTVPQHELKLGQEPAHLANGAGPVKATVELTSGQSWSSE